VQGSQRAGRLLTGLGSCHGLGGARRARRPGGRRSRFLLRTRRRAAEVPWGSPRVERATRARRRRSRRPRSAPAERKVSASRMPILLEDGKDAVRHPVKVDGRRGIWTPRPTGPEPPTQRTDNQANATIFLRFNRRDHIGTWPMWAPSFTPKWREPSLECPGIVDSMICTRAQARASARGTRQRQVDDQVVRLTR